MIRRHLLYHVKGYVRTSFILQQQLAKQSSMIEGNKKYSLRKFAKLDKRLKTAQLKSRLGREKILCEGGFGSLSSIQLSDAGNGEAQIALLHDCHNEEYVVS